MNLGCCIIFFVFYFVGFEEIEGTITSRHANKAVKKWRQEKSIIPDMLPDHAVFMGASELTKLREHSQFKKPFTVLDKKWEAEIAERKEKDPKYKPTIYKGFEDIEEGDFTYVDGEDKYHVIWGKSFVEAGDLKTDVADKVVDKFKTVDEEGKEVEKKGAEVTLTVEKNLTPKMLVEKGIHSITGRWEKNLTSEAVKHNMLVEMRVGVFMLKCINTHKWDPARSVVVFKLKYKSASDETDYFLKPIKAYRARTYYKSEEGDAKFQDNLKYSVGVSKQAEEDAEKWKPFSNVDQQATKDTQQDSRPKAKSNKPMKPMASTPSKEPAPSSQQTDSNTTKAFNFNDIKRYFEGYAKANEDAAKQKRKDKQDAKKQDAQAKVNFAATLNKWIERMEEVNVDIVKAVYEARFLKLKEAKNRAKGIGYAERKNMYRIELNIPKPSTPLHSIFTEKEYIIHKILEKKNEFPYFLYTHATDIGYGYRETPDGKAYATVVLIQVGDLEASEEDLNKAIYNVIVANIKKTLDASARLFNDETDTLPPALYELVYGGGTNEELSKVQDKVLKEIEDQGLTPEEIQAKIRTAQQDYLNTTAHPEEGDTKHKAPAPAEKKVVKPGSLLTEVIAGIASPPKLKSIVP